MWEGDFGGRRFWGKKSLRVEGFGGRSFFGGKSRFWRWRAWRNEALGFPQPVPEY